MPYIGPSPVTESVQVEVNCVLGRHHVPSAQIQLHEVIEGLLWWFFFVKNYVNPIGTGPIIPLKLAVLLYHYYILYHRKQVLDVSGS